MAKVRNITIQNKLNKRSAEYAIRLVGDRTLDEVYENTNVPKGTLSKILSGVSKPKPETIRKLTERSSMPQNGTNYEEFMMICGYLSQFKALSDEDIDEICKILYRDAKGCEYANKLRKLNRTNCIHADVCNQLKGSGCMNCKHYKAEREII